MEILAQFYILSALLIIAFSVVLLVAKKHS